MNRSRKRLDAYARHLQQRVPGRALLLGVAVAIVGVAALRYSLAENSVPEAPKKPFISAEERAKNKIIVKYKPAVAEGVADSSVARVQAEEVNAIDDLDMKVLRTPDGKRQQVISQLEQDPNIEYAVPVKVASLEATKPNDPDFSRQWSLRAILADPLWDKAQGSSNVIVAVIDGGVANHEDLNPGRYVLGHNFIDNNTDLTDETGHGTMVTGIIAATANNNLGVTGICWSCRIMPLKVSGPDGKADTASIIEAVHYAADNGADIANISIGGIGEYEPYKDAMEYAGSQGMMVTTSAGNGSTDEPHVPSMYEPAISVAGTLGNDSLHPGSNFGSTVDIAAPYSVYGTDFEGAYKSWSGTSFSAPTVAGILAVLKSSFPEATPAQLRDAITSTADPCCDGKISGGRVNAIKAYDKLAGTQDTDTVKPALEVISPAEGATVSGTSVLMSVAASDNTGVIRVHMGIGNGSPGNDSELPYILQWDSTTADDGPTTLYFTAYDNAGNISTATRNVTVNNAGPDTSKPAASITAPAEGATVGGTVQVGVTASDANGIGKVVLTQNDTVLATDVAPPYSLALDTTKLSNGPTQITVQAFDASSNQTDIVRNLTVQNGTTPPPTTPPPGGSPKPADINGSGKVDLTDLSILLSNWNKTTANADLNSSGKVDLTDLSMLLSKWNTAG